MCSGVCGQDCLGTTIMSPRPLPEEETSTSRRVYSSDGVNKSTHYLTAFVSGYRPLNGIRHGAYSIKLSLHSNSSTVRPTPSPL